MDESEMLSYDTLEEEERCETLEDTYDAEKSSKKKKPRKKKKQSKKSKSSKKNKEKKEKKKSKKKEKKRKDSEKLKDDSPSMETNSSERDSMTEIDEDTNEFQKDMYDAEKSNNKKKRTKRKKKKKSKKSKKKKQKKKKKKKRKDIKKLEEDSTSMETNSSEYYLMTEIDDNTKELQKKIVDNKTDSGYICIDVAESDNASSDMENESNEISETHDINHPDEQKTNWLTILTCIVGFTLLIILGFSIKFLFYSKSSNDMNKDILSTSKEETCKAAVDIAIKKLSDHLDPCFVDTLPIYTEFINQCDEDTAQQYISQDYAIFCKMIEERKEKNKLADMKRNKDSEVERKKKIVTMMDNYLNSEMFADKDRKFEKFVKYAQQSLVNDIDFLEINAMLIDKSHEKEFRNAFNSAKKNVEANQIKKALQKIKDEITTLIKDAPEEIMENANYASSCVNQIEPMIKKKLPVLYQENEMTNVPSSLKDEIEKSILKELTEYFGSAEMLQKYDTFRNTKIEEKIVEIKKQLQKDIDEHVVGLLWKRFKEEIGRKKQATKNEACCQKIKKSTSDELIKLSEEEYKKMVKVLTQEVYKNKTQVDSAFDKSFNNNKHLIQEFQDRDVKESKLKEIQTKYDAIYTDISKSYDDSKKEYDVYMYYYELHIFIVLIVVLIVFIIIVILICNGHNMCCCCCHRDRKAAVVGYFVIAFATWFCLGELVAVKKFYRPARRLQADFNNKIKKLLEARLL